MASLAGLILSLFAKRGADFSAFALDLITTAESPNDCIFELAVSYLVVVSSEFLHDLDQELLIKRLTKQGDDTIISANSILFVYGNIRGEFSDELNGI